MWLLAFLSPYHEQGTPSKTRQQINQIVLQAISAIIEDLTNIESMMYHFLSQRKRYENHQKERRLAIKNLKMESKYKNGTT
jgi:hypothetical protein